MKALKILIPGALLSFLHLMPAQATENSNDTLQKQIKLLDVCLLTPTADLPMLGISGIRFNPETQQIFVVSDDTGVYPNIFSQNKFTDDAPVYGLPRFYKMPVTSLNTKKKRKVVPKKIRSNAIEEVTLIENIETMQYLKNGHVDLESLTFTPEGLVVIASEQGAKWPVDLRLVDLSGALNVASFAYKTSFFSAIGQFFSHLYQGMHLPDWNIDSRILLSDDTGLNIASYVLPDHFRNRGLSPISSMGISRNKGIEGLDRVPNTNNYVAITERSLIQDEAAWDTQRGTAPSRLIIFSLDELATGDSHKSYLPAGKVRTIREGFYKMAPLDEWKPEIKRVKRSVVDVAVVDKDYALVLEKNYIQPHVGNNQTISRVYLLDLNSGTDVSVAPAPTRKTMQEVVFMDNSKLVLDSKAFEKKYPRLKSLNIEGLSLGPDLDNDRKSLILISDNGANTKESSQILYFSLPASAFRK